jgi:hypothetical protein
MIIRYEKLNEVVFSRFYVLPYSKRIILFAAFDIDAVCTVNIFQVSIIL